MSNSSSGLAGRLEEWQGTIWGLDHLASFWSRLLQSGRMTGVRPFSLDLNFFHFNMRNLNEVILKLSRAFLVGYPVSEHLNYFL